MGSAENELDHRDNEGPEHLVTLTQSYYLAIYQVTQRQFEQVMGRNPSSFLQSSLHPGRHHPVDTVSREDAQTFCDLLSEVPEERAAGRRYRLPTEAEWEHACRAGVSSWPTYFGRSLSSIQANFDGGRPYGRAREGPYLQRTTPVGSYAPNLFGLYDMHGNVWEWCQDDYHSRAYRTRGRVDPLVLEDGARGVLRGGSWHSDGPWCRSAYRCSDSVDSRYNWNGFRLVCEAGESG
jgi:formylglycine-generating enzyme required for sulfatase activity